MCVFSYRSVEQLSRNLSSIYGRRESRSFLTSGQQMPYTQTSVTHHDHYPTHHTGVHYSASNRPKSFGSSSYTNYDDSREYSQAQTHSYHEDVQQRRPSYSHPHATKLSPLLPPDHQQHTPICRQHSHEPPRSPIHLTVTPLSRRSSSDTHGGTHHSSGGGGGGCVVLSSPLPQQQQRHYSSSSQQSCPVSSPHYVNTHIGSPLLTTAPTTHLSPMPSGRRQQRHGSCIEVTGGLTAHPQHAYASHRHSVSRIGV